MNLHLIYRYIGDRDRGESLTLVLPQSSTEVAVPGTGARHYTMEFFEMCSALITQLAR